MIGHMAVADVWLECVIGHRATIQLARELIPVRYIPITPLISPFKVSQLVQDLLDIQ